MVDDTDDKDLPLLPVLEPAKKKRGRPPGSKNKPKDAVIDLKTEDEWRREVSAAWLGLFSILQFIGKLFGYVSDDLSIEEADSDAVALTPIVKRHPAIAGLFSIIGTPVIILRRISQKFRKAKREPPPPPLTPKENPRPANEGPPNVSPLRAGN